DFVSGWPTSRRLRVVSRSPELASKPPRRIAGTTGQLVDTYRGRKCDREQERLAGRRFEEHRAHLRAVAYRSAPTRPSRSCREKAASKSLRTCATAVTCSSFHGRFL